MTSCPCGSAADFDCCCAPYIAGQLAPTAEALMRSRYSAIAMGELDYIEKTCTEDAVLSFNRVEFERSSVNAEWLSLEIRSVKDGGADDTTGEVTFAFRYRYQGRELLQVEEARFVKENGAWLFDGSEINPKAPPVRAVQIGRNDPCPCGSGKKYKKCCYANG